ncbi:MAG: SPOR domain-containing protein [Muribaculaceae bacterium]|nr:SPOR domain-containing protein [Muribaculaceae bacterium]
MRHDILKWIAPLLVLALFTGCKTTEKNYKAAYDVAIQKKKAENSAEELGIEGMLEQTEGPSKRVMAGATFYFESRKLKRVDTSEVMRGRYCVVIASYKMKTNCLAQVKDMQEKGYEAFAAQDGDGKYYVVIGVLPSLQEAAEFCAGYISKEKPASYVGLTAGPVVIRS